jgi:hypothetical protein
MAVTAEQYQLPSWAMREVPPHSSAAVLPEVGGVKSRIMMRYSMSNSSNIRSVGGSMQSKQLFG